MILTITLNPAVDTQYRMKGFSLNRVNRVLEVERTPGGKGLNVSKVIKKLEGKLMATGFIGGKNGEFIKEKLQGVSICHEFLEISGETRICIAVQDGDGSTELLENGPEITEEEWKNFLEKLRRIVQGSGVICASGSLPQGVPRDAYRQIGDICKKEGIRFILDSSGSPLKEALISNPYLIKPNRDELEALFSVKIDGDEDLLTYGKQLQRMGAENVLITLGGDGAFLLTRGDIYRAILPKIEAVNTVGSGDATVAGFAVGIERGLRMEEALRLGLACGSSNAMLATTGDIDVSVVEHLKERIEIIRVS